MSHQPTRLSRLRRYRPGAAATAAAASVVTALALTVPSAVAGHADDKVHAVPPPPAQPTSASQIQNVDQVKTAIKAYYGDTVTTTPDPGRRRDHPARVLADRRVRQGGHEASAGASSHYLAKRAHSPRHGFDGKPAADLRHRRHHADDVRLRDLLELRLQPRPERGLRQQRGLPGDAGHGQPRHLGAQPRLYRLLPDRPSVSRSGPARSRT